MFIKIKFIIIVFMSVFVFFTQGSLLTDENIVGTYAFLGTAWCVDPPLKTGIDPDKTAFDINSHISVSDNVHGVSQSVIRVHRGGSASMYMVRNGRTSSEEGLWEIVESGRQLKLENSSGKLYLEYIGDLSSGSIVLAIGEGAKEGEQICDPKWYMYPFSKIE